MISSPTRKVGPFIGNDVTTVFPFSFKVFKNADLLVVMANTVAGTESTLVLDTDYSVSLNADQDNDPGGDVTLFSALATNYTLVISSAVENTQQTQLMNGGPFNATDVMQALDRVTIQVQQMDETLARAIKFPISDPDLLEDVPIAANRKGKVLGFKAVDGSVEAVTISGTTGPAGAPGVAGGNGYVNTVSDASVPQGNSSGSGSSANAALTTAMSTYSGRTLMVPSAAVHHITADLTITNPIEVSGAGGFYVDSGKTLTLKGVRLPFAQCFFGPGTVKVLGVPYVLSQWYGAVGDGTTDDYAAIQRALDQNPSSHVYLQPTSFSATGATPASYKINTRLQLNGEGQKLSGMMMAKYLGGTKVKVASGVGGVLGPSTYNNQQVKNIFWEGSDLANRLDSTTFENYTSLASITNLATSGIEMAGGSPSVTGCRISSFKGHGIEIYGDSGGQPDMWYVANCYVDYNRGFGMFVAGVDANVGTGHHLWFEGNLLGGKYDGADYGNTWDTVHYSLNANNGMSAGASKTIAAANGIVVSSGVATVTAVAHGMSAGQWATSAGSDDTGYNETAKILTIPDADHLTYATAHANGTTQNGTIAKSSTLQIQAYYLAHGIACGPIVNSNFSAGGRLEITPYMEGNSVAPTYGADTLTINAQGIAFTATTGHHMYATSGPAWYFKGGHWIFRPQLAGDLFIIRNVANDTNMLYVDVSGNLTTIGTKVNLGASPSANSNAINMSNTWGIYAKTTGGANSRGLYFHSDDTWYVGDSTRAMHLQATATDVSGTLAVTGATTLTGGGKVGSGGTLLTQVKVYSQTITPAATAANTAVEQTFTVTGLTTADKVNINPGAMGNACIPVACRVTAADTLGITFLNPTGGSLTSSSVTYQIFAIRS